jgi:hypothetical protein
MGLLDPADSRPEDKRGKSRRLIRPATGGPRMPDPAAAIRMLDMVEELFDGGRRWIKGRLSDRKGNHCLVGAIGHLRRTHGIRRDETEKYLKCALPLIATRLPYPTIESFNDSASSYVAIKSLLKRARARALRALIEQGIERELAAALQPPKPAVKPPALQAPQPAAKPQPSEADIPIPLVLLKHLSPERRAELRESAPGLRYSLDRIEREEKRRATIETLKTSVAEAVEVRKLELTQ